MTAMIRFYATGIVLTTALAGVIVARPEWLEILGVEVATRQQSQTRLVHGPAEACALYEARSQAKTAIVNQLQAGELDLFQAAAWFHHINQTPVQDRDRSWLLIQGDSAEEKQCWQVINWARSHFEDSMPPSELDLFIRKLEGQLSNRLSEHGRIELASW